MNSPAKFNEHQRNICMKQRKSTDTQGKVWVEEYGAMRTLAAVWVEEAGRLLLLLLQKIWNGNTAHKNKHFPSVAPDSSCSVEAVTVLTELIGQSVHWIFFRGCHCRQSSIQKLENRRQHPVISQISGVKPHTQTVSPKQSHLIPKQSRKWDNLNSLNLIPHQGYEVETV